MTKCLEKKDFRNIIDAWNEFAKMNNLPIIYKITPARQRGVNARLREEMFDFEQIAKKIENSDFLLGKKLSWKVDFDWVFCSPNNYIKILEGKYDNKIEDKRLKGLNERFKRAFENHW